MEFLKPNIGPIGRLIRGLGGLLLLGGGIWSTAVNLLAAAIFLISGGFVLLEAVRGWCALRACGIRTRF